MPSSSAVASSPPTTSVRLGMDVLRHRVLITYEAEAEEVTPEDVVQRILDRVEVP